MAVTTISSREFNQDTSRAKKAASSGPVIITDRGQPAHVRLDRIDAEPNLGQRLELIKGDRLARTGTAQALHGMLVDTRDTVEYRDDVACIGIGFLDGGREQ